MDQPNPLTGFMVDTYVIRATVTQEWVHTMQVMNGPISHESTYTAHVS